MHGSVDRAHDRPRGRGERRGGARWEAGEMGGATRMPQDACYGKWDARTRGSGLGGRGWGSTVGGGGGNELERTTMVASAFLQGREGGEKREGRENSVVKKKRGREDIKQGYNGKIFFY